MKKLLSRILPSRNKETPTRLGVSRVIGYPYIPPVPVSIDHMINVFYDRTTFNDASRECLDMYSPLPIPLQLAEVRRALPPHKYASSWVVGSTAHSTYQACINDKDTITAPNDVDILVELPSLVSALPTQVKLECVHETAHIVYSDDTLSPKCDMILLNMRELFAGVKNKSFMVYLRKSDSEYTTHGMRVLIVALNHEDKKYQRIDLFLHHSITTYIRDVPLVHDGIAFQVDSLPTDLGLAKKEDRAINELYYISSPEYTKQNNRGDNSFIFDREVYIRYLSGFSDRLRRKSFTCDEVSDIMNHIKASNSPIINDSIRVGGKWNNGTSTLVPSTGY